MRRTTKDQFRSIRWKPFSYLKDLDLHLCKAVGLNVSSKKIEIMALNTINTRPVQIDHEELPYTDIFTNLGSIIGRDKRTDLDIQSRLNKVRNSLNTMNKVWRSSIYSTRTKLKLYHSCDLKTLLYGSERWRLTEKDLSKLSTFQTKSLRLFGPNIILKKDLFERCRLEPMVAILMRRCWRWIGRVTFPEASIAKTALYWTP